MLNERQAVTSLNRIVSVIGLGYVGLPVAVAFGRKGYTVGFDIKKARIDELSSGLDRTGEVSREALNASNIFFTRNPCDIARANFHIVAVPTPIDPANRPDMALLFSATEMVGDILKKGDIVVYESTVYPGATEEGCVPILESKSGLTCGTDFKVGYSPERINPGDKEHTFDKIKKVVSGCDEEALHIIAEMYGSVVSAGVHRAPTIKVAEAAKVIENIQRDLNIALMNELALIFNIMEIDTQSVLAAASTKWNFLRFQPGLVGGHCIGVDPYYLTHQAEKMGYISQVILAGRRINNAMAKFTARRTIKEMIKRGHKILGSVVTVLGITFKENCPDVRNSKVADIIHEFVEYGIDVQVHDPHADPEEALRAYGIPLTRMEDLKKANAVVVAVAHESYRNLTAQQFVSLMNEKPVLIDVKGIYDRETMTALDISFWRL